MPVPRREALLLAAFVAIGALLRFPTLDLQSFWFDEAVTVKLVRMGLDGMLDRIPETESTPPLYYLLAWLWAKAFGTGEAGLRSLSALCGTLVIPALAAAAAELASRRAALVVAALAAFNPLLVWYSQEARAYALLTLLGAVSLLFFARALRRPGRGPLVAWALAAALALATHYFAIFLVAPQAGWLLARARERRMAVAATAGVVAVELALLPLALEQKSLDLASFIRSAPLEERAVQAIKQYLVGFDAPLEAALAAVAGVIALAGIVAALIGRLRPGVVAAAVVGVASVVLPFAVALGGLDYVGTRNIILSLLPFAVVVAAGLVRSRPGLAGAGALCAVGLAAVIGVALTPRWQRDDWRPVAAALGPAPVPRAIVVAPAQGSTVPLTLYRSDLAPMPASGALVDQVALVSTVDRAGETTHAGPPPRPPAPQLPGFAEVRRRYAESYTLIVLASPGPVPVSPAQLAGSRLLPREGASVLLQRPRQVSAGV